MNTNPIMPQQVVDDSSQKVPQHSFTEKDMQAVASHHFCGEAWYHTREELVATSRMEPCLLICDYFKALLPFFKSLVPQFFRNGFILAIALPTWLL